MVSRINIGAVETLPRRSVVTDLLTARGRRDALVTDDGVVSYGDLSSMVADATDRLGRRRRLVSIEAEAGVDAVVWYLAALAGRHPAILLPAAEPTRSAAIDDRYRPGVVVGRRDGAWQVEERDVATPPLHPSLALLLSTSGSTGSPKLVRLSARNLLANARAIITYLGITGDDRAITTLPLHYCYGLSILNTHLLAGGSVVLDSSSVIDRSFWTRFGATRPTSIAGVPHTFDLLDRIGFDGMDLPSLRYVTQAGGRLDPSSVERYARLGEASGWRFYVMYGQTEATARMAYLPPALATAHPGSIGRPIDRGSFALDTSVVDPESAARGQADNAETVGELVYRGPNVMLGYARSADDLAAGRTVDALRTGDLGRRLGDGLYEVVGRRARRVKVFGHRIDLDHLQATVDHAVARVAVSGRDDRLVVAGPSAAALSEARRSITRSTRLPPTAIVALVVDEIPRTPTGKIDHTEILARAFGPVPWPPAADRVLPSGESPAIERSIDLRDDAPSVRATGPGHRPEASFDAAPTAAEAAIVDLYRNVLETDEAAPDRSFVTLGGDSLNYVRLSIELERHLGHLPDRWHERTIAALAATRGPRTRFRRVETTIALRAVAMILIVATHAGLVGLPAGAHVLLAVAGYNFARFQLRSNRRWPAIARVAVPSIAWIALVAVLTGDYPLSTVLLVHNAVGGAAWTAAWRFWFIDVLVQTLVGAALLFSIPAVRRVERRWPFGLAAVAVGVALVLRHDVFDVLLSSREGGRTATALWAFTIGWAAARATTRPQQLLVTAAVPVAVVGFFSSDLRVAMIMVGLAALVWLPRVALPRPVIPAVRTIAAASLAIYLVHWNVFPWLGDMTNPLVATVGSLGAGIVLWAGARLAGRSLRAQVRPTQDPTRRQHRLDALTALNQR